MGLKCGCPAGAHLADLSIPDCKESMGQVQKVIFQRMYQADGTKNVVASPTLKASWTALLSAANDTKCIISPYIQGPTTEPGAARTWGGGNDSLGGIPVVIGAEPTKFSGNIYQESQSVIKVLKSYTCENIGVYLIDENGHIGCIAEETTAGAQTTTTYHPIPICAFFVGDKSLGGYDAPDGNAISWSFFPNWSDNFVMVTPTDFNPLTDLVNVASA
jgi:hypothetical protein